MHIPGHIAIALAQHCLPILSTNEKTLRPLLLASLFPDMVDKTIGYIFHAMPNGRHYAHNIFSMIGLTLLVTLIWGKSTGYAWFAGYLGHLMVDRQGLMPWFFPVKKYHFKRGRLTFSTVQLVRETTFLVLILFIHRLSRHPNK